MKIRTIIAAACAAFAFSMAGPVSSHDGETETVTKNFEAAIPNSPGKSLLAVEVNYAPGAASPPHTHAKSAFIYAYVISGEIESKVNDGETRIYRAGESWSEPPGAIHSISRNASKTEPAKLLAVFVLDTNDDSLTTPITSSTRIRFLVHTGHLSPPVVAFSDSVSIACGASVLAVVYPPLWLTAFDCRKNRTADRIKAAIKKTVRPSTRVLADSTGRTEMRIPHGM